MTAWWNALGRSKKTARPKKKTASKGKRKPAAGARKTRKAAATGARTPKKASKKPAKAGTRRKPAKAPARRKKAGRERVQLRWIAQARSGDKGDIANIALFAPTEEMYEIFRREVTARRVKAHFGDFVKGRVDRYEAANVRALNFVAHASLGGGGASSLRSDPLGKSYGSNLLRMEIEVPTDVLARTPKWKPPKTLPNV